MIAPTCDRQGRLHFGSDCGPRQLLQVPAARRHPGKLHLGFLAHLLTQEIAPGSTLLDPMAGAGSLLYATLNPWRCNVVLNELESHWVETARASWHRLTTTGFDRPAGWACLLQGDARTLSARLAEVAFGAPIDVILTSPPYADAQGVGVVGAGLQRGLAENPKWGRTSLMAAPTYDAVITSPPYENALSHQRHGEDYHPERMAGHDRWGKHTTQSLRRQRLGYDPPPAGAPPTGQRNPAQIGNLSGRRYEQAMAEVYGATVPLLAPGGAMIVVLKNIVRRHQEVDLIGQTVAQLAALGLVYARTYWRAVTPGAFHNIRRKADPAALVIDREAALVFHKPEAAS